MPEKPQQPDVRIDPEFQSLIPPLRAKEKALLEENIKCEGCREALAVWREPDDPAIAIIPDDDR